MKPDSNESFNELLSELLSTEFDGQTGIIYARTIFEVENLTKDLKAMGHKVGCYHANLSSDDR
jgi:superfamily II DNA helicase RecQ